MASPSTGARRLRLSGFSLAAGVRRSSPWSARCRLHQRVNPAARALATANRSLSTTTTETAGSPAWRLAGTGSLPSRVRIRRIGTCATRTGMVLFASNRLEGFSSRVSPIATMAGRRGLPLVDRAAMIPHFLCVSPLCVLPSARWSSRLHSDRPAAQRASGAGLAASVFSALARRSTTRASQGESAADNDADEPPAQGASR